MRWIRVVLLVLFLMPGFIDKVSAQKKHSKKEVTRRLSYMQTYAHPLYSKFSVLLSAGFNAYSGELSKPTDSNLQPYQNNPSIDGGLHFQWTHFVSCQLRVGWNQIQSTTYTDNWANRSFEMEGYSTELRLEHSIFPQQEIEGIYRRWNPFISFGAGFLKYKGQAQDDFKKTWAYKGSSLTLPIGVGIRYYATERMGFALEGTYYYLQTDLIDDTRLSSSTIDPNDGYFNYRLSLKYQLRKRFNYKHYLKRIGSS